MTKLTTLINNSFFYEEGIIKAFSIIISVIIMWAITPTIMIIMHGMEAYEYSVEFSNIFYNNLIVVNLVCMAIFMLGIYYENRRYKFYKSNNY